MMVIKGNIIMFIKYADGKITDILPESKLTEDQKKSVKEAVIQDEKTDTSLEKKSGS
jgi:hypothetical protein